MTSHEKFQEQCEIIFKSLCSICPHQNDKHAMNCLECCPLMRSKESLIEKRMRERISAPWMLPPLHSWSIVGMNHYNINNVKCIFVAMTKDNKIIRSEGEDTIKIWTDLIEQAKNLEKE